MSRIIIPILCRTVSITLFGCRKKASEATDSSKSSTAAAEAKVKEAKSIALEAYVDGYLLLTTAVTRVQISHVPKQEGLKSPMGQFTNVPRSPPADYRGVSAPNADTLYSITWVDLAEPVVFSHPDMGKRFSLFEMVDLWMTIVQTPGSRPNGGKAAHYLINWSKLEG